MHPLVARGIDEVVGTFGAEHVVVEPVDDGGSWVTVLGREIGDGWDPAVADITARVLTTYPKTLPYPFYLPTGTRRVVGAQPGNLGDVTIDGRSFAQLSLNPASKGELDTLVARFVGVVSWLRRYS
jgi:hypothetical protein